MAKGKTRQVVIEVSYTGTITVELPAKDAEAFIDQMDGIEGDVDVDALPFAIDWNDYLNSGDGRVESCWLKGK